MRGTVTDGIVWEQRFKALLKDYNKDASVKIDRLTPHVCRHTFCTEMARAHMDVKVLQKIMGHSSVNVTLGFYTDFTDEDVVGEMNRVAGAEKQICHTKNIT